MKRCAKCQGRFQENEGEVSVDGEFVCSNCAEGNPEEGETACPECEESSEELKAEGVCPACGYEADQKDEEGDA